MLRKLKWLVVCLLLLYLVVFATANTQKLTIYYFYNKPILGYKPIPENVVEQAIARGQEPPKPTDPREVPLILVLFVSVFFGIILASLAGTVERFKYGAEIRKQKREIKTEKKILIQETRAREKEEKLREKEEKKKAKEEAKSRGKKESASPENSGPSTS